MTLAMLNAPLISLFGLVMLVVLIILARMAISRGYFLAIRWFGFNLTLSPGARTDPHGVDRP